MEAIGVVQRKLGPSNFKRPFCWNIRPVRLKFCSIRYINLLISPDFTGFCLVGNGVCGKPGTSVHLSGARSSPGLSLHLFWKAQSILPCPSPTHLQALVKFRWTSPRHRFWHDGSPGLRLRIYVFWRHTSYDAGRHLTSLCRLALFFAGPVTQEQNGSTSQCLRPAILCCEWKWI